MATKNATLTTRMTRQFDGRITAKEAKGDSSNSWMTASAGVKQWTWQDAAVNQPS